MQIIQLVSSLISEEIFFFNYAYSLKPFPLLILRERKEGPEHFVFIFSLSIPEQMIMSQPKPSFTATKPSFSL